MGVCVCVCTPVVRYKPASSCLERWMPCVRLSVYNCRRHSFLTTVEGRCYPSHILPVSLSSSRTASTSKTIWDISTVICIRLLTSFFQCLVYPISASASLENILRWAHVYFLSLTGPFFGLIHHPNFSVLIYVGIKSQVHLISTQRGLRLQSFDNPLCLVQIHYEAALDAGGVSNHHYRTRGASLFDAEEWDHAVMSQTYTAVDDAKNW